MVKMHEFSIAEGIVKSILEEAEKNKAKKVKKIFLDIGGLTMISEEQLLFALEVLSRGTIAEGMKVDIQMFPIGIECGNGHKNQIPLNGQDIYTFISQIKCPDCGGNVKISNGKELIIKKIMAE